MKEITLTITEEEYWVLRDAITTTLEDVIDADDDEFDGTPDDRERLVNSLQSIADKAEAAFKS